MKRHTLLTGLLLFAGAVLPIGAANLVANGSFELGTLGIGSFQGWQTNLGDISTFVDSSGQTGPLYGQAFDGLWAAYFGSTAADGGASISQSLATTIGQQYLLTFELANDNGGLPPINNFIATVGAQQAFSFTNLPAQPYTSYQFTFIAASNQTPLTLFGSNDNSYLELDDVAVVPVPEPAALGLLTVGVLLTTVVLRRRPSISLAR
jgi:flagellin